MTLIQPNETNACPCVECYGSGDGSNARYMADPKCPECGGTGEPPLKGAA